MKTGGEHTLIRFDFQCKAFDIPEVLWQNCILKLISKYGQQPGLISIVFCDDEYLLDLNKKFLNHDYYTDIITFPLDGASVSGELYISIDRVRDNARLLKQDPETEKQRVILHGILHLLGFKDKTKKEQTQMRRMEDEALEACTNSNKKKDHYYDWVYDVVRCIPKGRVSTYGAIADFLTLGSARMVGWALNQLKGTVKDVPAHRVVNFKGELTGRLMFGEAGERMGKLLRKEGVNIVDHKVTPMEKYFWHPGDS